MNLTNKVAIVTGATKGIGKATADLLESYGAKVMRTFHNIPSDHHNDNWSWLNLSSDCSIRKVVDDTLFTFGKIDILVNNAGIIQRVPFEAITRHDLTNMFNINVNGMVMLTQLVIEHMEEQGSGNIVNIASIGGQIGGRVSFHYAMAKAAIINYTKSLSNLYAKDGIIANCIAPSMTLNTGMADITNLNVNDIPMRRFGKPDDVAKVVAFLSSDLASYVSGQVINVNGGQYG